VCVQAEAGEGVRFNLVTSEPADDDRFALHIGVTSIVVGTLWFNGSIVVGRIVFANVV